MSEVFATQRAQLEERRAQLIRDLENARETAPSAMSPGDEGTYSNHLADEATTTYQREQNLSLERHMARELAAVEEALQRIDQDTYGFCESCGGPIGRERLEAMPVATMCIQCKTRHESRR